MGFIAGPARAVVAAPARARRPPAGRRGPEGDRETAVPELSGIDLARQALLAAREAAKTNGAQTKKPKRHTGTVLRQDGRKPLGLGAVIGMVMTERGPAAGGSVPAQWETILAAAALALTGHFRAWSRCAPGDQGLTWLNLDPESRRKVQSPDG
ncbi:hypothetical protein ACWD4X_31410 [Streptomyces termitum]